MDAEIWRDVDDYDGLYQVSNFGRVKSFKHRSNGRIMKLRSNHKGYLCVRLSRNNESKQHAIHRLVATAFIPNPEDKLTVNHINGDKTDNRVENLEWASYTENMRHAFATGLKVAPQGEDSYQAKLTNGQVVYIRDNPDGLNTYELARLFKTTPTTISDVQCGKKYRNADGRIREPRHQKPAIRLSNETRDEIRRLYVKGSREFGSVALARKFGVDHSTILNIIHEK